MAQMNLQMDHNNNRRGRRPSNPSSSLIYSKPCLQNMENQDLWFQQYLQSPQILPMSSTPFTPAMNGDFIDVPMQFPINNTYTPSLPYSEPSFPFPDFPSPSWAYQTVADASTGRGTLNPNFLLGK